MVLARLYGFDELHPNLHGWLEDRGTGEMREATLLTKGTKGFCFEIAMPEAKQWPIMVTRYFKAYNALLKSGWRFWTEQPDTSDWVKWDVK